MTAIKSQVRRAIENNEDLSQVLNHVEAWENEIIDDLAEDRIASGSDVSEILDELGELKVELKQRLQRP